jgi:hypothetical protein
MKISRNTYIRLELYYTKQTKAILRLNQIEQRYFVLTVATDP